MYRKYKGCFDCAQLLAPIVSDMLEIPVGGRLLPIVGRLVAPAANSYGALLTLVLKGDGMDAMKIARSIYEPSRNVARRISTTALYRRSRRERKKVEMLFAHLERILNLDRLRLRGLSGAKDEFTLAAVAQNLRRLATLMPLGPPNGIGASV